MRMLVVFVMNVRMRMDGGQVDMLMFMALREVQPNAQAHKAAGHKQLNCDGFS